MPTADVVSNSSWHASDAAEGRSASEPVVRGCFKGACFERMVPAGQRPTKDARHHLLALAQLLPRLALRSTRTNLRV